ncbi:MAG: TetR/AcrR family transcriptional regulator [Anaerolineae bacterium]|nr:TetR/AcrR family transcriptional regulator [Anaerolineae bacterium]
MTESESKARRDAILDAALQVFSEVGYERATIKAIATAAGIKSPALLYWYFPTKADLMQGVLARFIPVIEPNADIDALLAMPIEDLLRMIGMAMIAMIQNPQAVMAYRIVMSEVLHNPASNAEIARIGPVMILNLLRRALTANIERGVLRPHNVEVSSRMFIGPLILFILGSSVFTAAGEGLPPPHDYVDAMIAHWLDGIRAEKE